MDLIDRQEAIKAMTSCIILVTNDSVDAVTKVIELFTGKIKNLPSVHPERKTGRWIIDPGIGCKCSECDFDIGNDLDFMEYVNFCPNCGADMRGGQDE